MLSDKAFSLELNLLFPWDEKLSIYALAKLGNIPIFLGKRDRFSSNACLTLVLIFSQLLREKITNILESFMEVSTNFRESSRTGKWFLLWALPLNYFFVRWLNSHCPKFFLFWTPVTLHSWLIYLTQCHNVAMTDNKDS